MKVRFEGTELINCESNEIFRVPGLFRCLECGAAFRIEPEKPTEQTAEGDGSCHGTHTLEDEFLESP